MGIDWTWPSHGVLWNKEPEVALRQALCAKRAISLENAPASVTPSAEGGPLGSSTWSFVEQLAQAKLVFSLPSMQIHEEPNFVRW